MIALSCRDVSVIYGKTPVLTHVDLEIESGSWVTLIGRNGVGKTSLLRAIAGLTAFTGEIENHTGSIKALSVRERALAIAFVPQRPTVPRGMTVKEYVTLGRAAHIPLFGVERSSDMAVVADVLERLAIATFASRRVDELSGGEWQRVVLARALAQQSLLLLLDEPTTSLDIGHQQEALELIDELRIDNGLTVISTMHELTLAGQYADQVALLDPNGVVARGSAADVLTSELIRKHYGADVEMALIDGHMAMIPLRSRPTDG